jgi:hypothetical protein
MAIKNVVVEHMGKRCSSLRSGYMLTCLPVIILGEGLLGVEEVVEWEKEVLEGVPVVGYPRTLTRKRGGTEGYGHKPDKTRRCNND